MSMNPITLGRVSNLMRGNLVSSTVGRTQAQMLEVQQQLTTGKRLSAPSDDAGDAAIAQSIRKLLETRDAYKTNLGAADNNLSETDTSLSSVTDLLRQAQQIASANVGSDVTSDARKAAADVVDSIYSQLLTEGNKSVAGTYLFAGDRSTAAPFVEAGGGVQWVGSSTVLSNAYDEGTDKAFQVNGADVFGALSARVQGDQVLTPSLTAATRVDDLGGAGNAGVKRGIVELSDGTTTTTIDLSNADTIGDVITRINNAGVGDVTASINAAGDGIDLGGTGDITLKDVGGGSEAADLGIQQNVSAGPGVGIAGATTNAKVTNLTLLSSLRGGAGIDQTGLIITNGTTAKHIDLSSAKTVEDMLNAINNSGANVKAQINAAGTGIDIQNAVQGTDMTIAENGGSTAAELGIRSFSPTTKLADLNAGAGVGNVTGKTDLKLTDSAGVSYEIDLDGANTIQDVMDRINAGAAGAGAGIAATFANGTNQIILTDSAGGSGTMGVANVNNSTAAHDLGLDVAASGNTISSTDVGAVQSSGIFANIIRLRNALRSDDQTQITKASEGLSDDTDRVVRIRGQVGAKVQEFDARSSSLDDQNVTTQGLLSQLEDTDFTDAIVKFQTLQTSLQASMQAASKVLNLNLMDYLS